MHVLPAHPMQPCGTCLMMCTLIVCVAFMQSFNTSKSTYQIILTADVPIYNPNWMPVEVFGTVNVSFYDQQAGSTPLAPVIIPARTMPLVSATVASTDNSACSSTAQSA